MEELDVINPDAVEVDESDEEIISAAYERDRFSEAVVSASDWTTETILSQLKRENIFMNPRFQRRDAWTIPNKSRFIESLVVGLPIPQIVLAERKGARGKYIVLDGKQRLLSMLQFVGQSEGKNNGFILKGLEITEELEGKSYKDMCSDGTLSNQVNSFSNQTIRAVVIRNWPDLTFLHLVFLRLNTGSVKLSPQELRQAYFPGPFSDFIDDTASASSALKKLLRLDEPDFRMRDIELLVRYLAFQNFLEEYRGDMKQFLDDTCGKLNRDFGEITETRINNQIMEFEKATNAAITIFGLEDVARRPKEVGGRRAFNRAIFDALVFYFTRNDVRDSAVNYKDKVKTGFYDLWKSNNEFVKSVESTTKSIPATFTRLSEWGSKLREVLGIDVKVPIMEGGRIKP